MKLILILSIAANRLAQLNNYAYSSLINKCVCRTVHVGLT